MAAIESRTERPSSASTSERDERSEPRGRGPAAFAGAPDDAPARPAREGAHAYIAGVASSPLPKLSPPARLLALAGLPTLFIVGGTLGYCAIEGWPWVDALYKTVATLTATGADMPLTKLGRLFTIALALGGIFIVALAVTEVLRTVITGELRLYLEKRHMEKHIEQLEGHVIVCGYGRVGASACEHLQASGAPFVVIDSQTSALVEARAAGANAVLGDATVDAVLHRAGIARARALVTAASTDSANVLITMTARLLNPTLPIVARAIDEGTVPKLMRAGATRTVSPYAIGGGRIAEAVLCPATLDLIEVAATQQLDGVQLAEEPVGSGSALETSTIGASGLRSRLGLILLALKRRGGEIVFNPADDAVLAAGDTMIVMGPRAQLDRAHALALAARGSPHGV
jgi:voltage-gated potassium channel